MRMWTVGVIGIVAVRLGDFFLRVAQWSARYQMRTLCDEHR